VTVGSDSHSPDELRERIPLLSDRLDDAAIDIVDLSL
jgi:hypothetical protein